MTEGRVTPVDIAKALSIHRVTAWRLFDRLRRERPEAVTEDGGTLITDASNLPRLAKWLKNRGRAGTTVADDYRPGEIRRLRERADEQERRTDALSREVIELRQRLNRIESQHQPLRVASVRNER